MNWSEFFHMGGYAAYVWFSYGLTAVLLTIGWVLPVLRRKAILKKLARRLELEE